MVPMHKLKIIIIPKCIVFIPSAWQTGRKIGVKIRQAGVISIKVPTRSSKIFIMNKITYRLLLTPSIASETAVGMPVNAITQLIMLETPIKNIIIPVIWALSKNSFGSSESFNDL